MQVLLPSGASDGAKVKLVDKVKLQLVDSVKTVSKAVTRMDSFNEEFNPSDRENMHACFPSV